MVVQFGRKLDSVINLREWQYRTYFAERDDGIHAYVHLALPTRIVAAKVDRGSRFLFDEYIRFC